jgi:hypothetical protein
MRRRASARLTPLKSGRDETLLWSLAPSAAVACLCRDNDVYFAFLIERTPLKQRPMSPVIELDNGLYLATKEIATWRVEDVDVGMGRVEKRLIITKVDGSTEYLFGAKAETAIAALEH